jgi:hypothetical protein
MPREAKSITPTAAAWEVNGAMEVSSRAVGIPGTIAKIIINIASTHSSIVIHLNHESFLITTANEQIIAGIWLSRYR